jgi:hypothetical protein
LPLVDGVYELLEAHGKKLAGLGPAEEEGSAALFARGRAFRVRVIARGGEITFAVEG